MENWSKIIKLISIKQRILALFLLLLFPVISFLGGKYLETDDCRAIIIENQNLHQDFATVSSMVRELQLELLGIGPEPVVTSINKNGDIDGDAIIDTLDYNPSLLTHKILEITTSNEN